MPNLSAHYQCNYLSPQAWIMNPFLSHNSHPQIAIRPLQYRDLDTIAPLCEPITETSSPPQDPSHLELGQHLPQIRQWYGLLKFLNLFPNPCRYLFHSLVAEDGGIVRGAIQVSPFNRTRSTWRIDRVLIDTIGRNKGIDSQLLRHCFESIWEARTWLLEVNVNDTDLLALYRQNGFQPLAHKTYWSIAPERLEEIAKSTPDLPNLLPVSNADAPLLYQLDTVSMPPLLRQVFDRHLCDFQTSFINAVIDSIKQWLTQTEVISGYVFEPQRKAAIGYFQMQLSRKGTHPHIAQLTVHPAWTWLYPELMAQMARLTQDFPSQPLHLTSRDYQPEREAYLEEVGAQRIHHSLLMSRSVWHKLRESKSVSLEGLQLSDVLQSFQPTRKPIPSRMSWLGPANPLTPVPPGEGRTPTHSEGNSKTDTGNAVSRLESNLSADLPLKSQDISQEPPVPDMNESC